MSTAPPAPTTPPRLAPERPGSPRLMPNWSELFSLDASVLELFIRGTVTFLALLLLLRVVGQREAGGLGVSDLLLVVLIAQAVAGGLNGGSEAIVDGLILVLTILFWSVALDAIAYRWPRVARVIKGKPELLISRGRPNRRVMLRELMTTEELNTQLRLHGVEQPDRVRRAYLEPNGMISVMRYDGGEEEPVENPVR